MTWAHIIGACTYKAYHARGQKGEYLLVKIYSIYCCCTCSTTDSVQVCEARFARNEVRTSASQPSFAHRNGETNDSTPPRYTDGYTPSFFIECIFILVHSLFLAARKQTKNVAQVLTAVVVQQYTIILYKQHRTEYKYKYAYKRSPV